jgi:hypothetical protein
MKKVRATEVISQEMDDDAKAMGLTSDRPGIDMPGTRRGVRVSILVETAPFDADGKMRGRWEKDDAIRLSMFRPDQFEEYQAYKLALMGVAQTD